MEKSKLTSGIFTSRTDEWQTPKKVFNALNKEFNFVVDAAATKENAKCTIFWSKENSAPLSEWWRYRSIFINPPYSQNESFMKMAYEAGQFATVVVLTPCRTDTKWWHKYAMKADEIRFIEGRLKYNDGKQSAPFPSCVVIFRPILDKDKKSKSIYPTISSIKF